MARSNRVAIGRRPPVRPKVERTEPVIRHDDQEVIRFGALKSAFKDHSVPAKCCVDWIGTTERLTDAPMDVMRREITSSVEADQPWYNPVTPYFAPTLHAG